MGSRATDVASNLSHALPLFPLRTVLFPGGVLPLKIFEQRYVEMTKACLKDGQPFGVCLLLRGDEVATPSATPADFASVGTLARIDRWDMPQLGILHIAAIGETRFQVRKHGVTPSGLAVGDVESIAPEPRRGVPEAHAPLARLCEAMASRVGAEALHGPRDYADASWVGYRLAEWLPLPLSIKQSMLEIDDALVRLDVLREFLRRQNVL